ncbi:MBL fold metallo-hydrolase [Ramlibacter albus]|uniref:MBL fold metallo-hydrolase n=1 Tax=Ramlibacter albus TaxID=2079448 RepID=A0A923M8A3_9BURK|nr:MBL fold metallo-hydrolase [Ramlibacter albus]MBC5765825.1 MBL fold metallo-hydrolase [Ramlibacter albus]
MKYVTVSRRQWISTAAAVCCAAAMPRATRAAALQVPTVDSLTVKVVTDSSYDTPRPQTNKWVRVERVPFVSRADYRRALHNEWGLSLGLESRIGTDRRTMMLDFGYTPAALMNNMEIVGVRPEQLQALIVSHGHFDHYGGLVALLQKYRDKLPADLKLYVGGEENFCIRKSQTAQPGHFSDFGALDRRELAALKVAVVPCEQPRVIEGHAFSTGIIQRRSFERVLPNTFVDFSMKDGLGCNMPAENAKAEGKLAPDNHLHEHGTVFNVKDRGLVVITSCGHAGVVNTVKQAMEVSGIDKLHAVMGGIHLFPAPDDYILKTIEELKAMSPDVVVPLHCSGPGFVNAMRNIFADRLVTSTTGTIISFGAA